LLPAPDPPIAGLPTRRSGAPILCYVTDRKTLTTREDETDWRLVGKIRGTIGAGVDWVQVREKDLPPQKLLALVREIVRATDTAKLIVNDRLDVAVAAGAAGVHLGRESAPIREVVRWCRGGNAPKEFLIGASCHTLSEAREVEIAGASYLIFGPIFDTPSKRAFGEPVGIAELAQVCATVKIPVLAIGGIGLRNARECFQAGAAGIAAIRLFQDAENLNELKSIVASLRDDGWSGFRR
jgi:thiamine-phosphate pyrophosphorylase